jgi:zinc/manganese transport system permease protein
MTQMMTFMAALFAACLVLVGIHAYFGIHVIERRVLFVDLAVAQFTALGAVVGFVALTTGSRGRRCFPSALRRWRRGVRAHPDAPRRIPRRAVIGITFVLASAVTILVADRSAEGAEHIKETLAGSLLWVTWPTVLKDLIVYAVLGAVHVLLRHRFLLITADPEEAYRRGWRVRWWDFVFYLTFGVMITFSVEIGGILMVFSYLVIPACIAILAAHGLRARLVIGWTVGAVGSALGLLTSYAWDFPTGPAIVVVLGAMLVLAIAGRKLRAWSLTPAAAADRTAQPSGGR